MKILVFGLPGSGKTTFVDNLTKVWQQSPGEVNHLTWLNADEVRKEYRDWDFSPVGRKRQADRMRRLADEAVAWGHVVIADFVCPTQDLRASFGADVTVFMDTIESGRFDDTNKVFDRNTEVPYNYTITSWDQTGEVIEQILHKLSAVG